MSNRSLSVLVLSFILLLSGCSSSNKSEMADVNNTSASKMDNTKREIAGSPAADTAKPNTSVAITSDQANAASKESEKIDIPNQMVIYKADLSLRVKNFDQSLKLLEEKAGNFGGYIAESTVTKEGKEQMSGRITIRIPQTHFQEFLHEAEGQAVEIIQRNINGQDVTGEYVDLQSRLKSKRIVEDRLTAFMKNAEKTEDLLKISKDLASVQEDIETIEGRMKFLENQTALSTIVITLYENKVIVPNIEKDQLNTWEKTKKQFIKSINMLLAGLSGLIVFLIGNLPFIIVLMLIGFAIYLYVRKVKKRNRRG